MAPLLIFNMLKGLLVWCVDLFAAALWVVPTARRTVLPGQPALGSISILPEKPDGTTATVSSFTLHGSSTYVPAGSAPVLVHASGAVAGSLAVDPAGNYSFTPAIGFTGAVPPVTVNVANSDGQAVSVPLTFTVNPLLYDANEAPSLLANSGPLSVNVLGQADQPPGTTLQVTNFSVAGFSEVFSAGAAPITIMSPNGNRVIGTIAVLPNGSAIFDPNSRFRGQVPAILYTVASSDGQTNPSVLTITVQQGMCPPGRKVRRWYF